MPVQRQRPAQANSGPTESYDGGERGQRQAGTIRGKDLQRAKLNGAGAAVFAARELAFKSPGQSTQSQPLPDIEFSPGQQRLLKAIDAHPVTYVEGPAGTGKTFVAVYRALQALDAGEIERIVIARPTVEAGEKIGFLPGTEAMKMDPYLRPIYDAFEDLGRGHLLLPPPAGQKPIVEICALQFMRGRTYNKAYIVLDEMQNATEEQFEMATTRQGRGSKVIVTYDPNQCDLDKPEVVPTWAREMNSMLRELLSEKNKLAGTPCDAPANAKKQKRSPKIVETMNIMKTVPTNGFVKLTAREDNHRDPSVEAILAAFAKARGEATTPSPVAAPETATPAPARKRAAKAKLSVLSE